MKINEKVMDLFKERAALLRNAQDGLGVKMVNERIDDVLKKAGRAIDINNEIKKLLSNESYELHFKLHRALDQEDYREADYIKQDIKQLSI